MAGRKSIPVIDRFLEKISLPKQLHDCWEWNASTGSHGYGQLMMPGNKPITSHCFSYKHFIGPIPTGLHVLHSCDNRKCVNPSHLFLGTNNDNIQDRVNKGRSVKAMAKLSEDDVREMRRLYNVDDVPVSVLAQQFGIKPRTVYDVIKYVTWKHLNG